MKMTQVRKNIVTTILIVVGCVVVASGYELTRKYINTRIDRMLAQKLPAMVPPSPQKTAVVEGQPAGNAQLIASIGALDARIKALESLSLATNFGSNSDRPPLVSDYRGVGAPVFALFDRVGPYRKNGLFEIYGASLRERRTGAIRVSEADLEITHDEAWVIWSPDYSPARDATHLEVDFSAVPTAGKLTIGFIGKDGQASAYTINLGPPTLAPTGLLPPLLPADIVAKANAANSIGEPHPSANKVIAPLPANLMLQLRNGQPDQIQQWFVKINGAAGTTVRFKRLALIRPMPAVTTIGVTLSGRVSGADLPPETPIELLDDSGRVTKQTLGADGGFAFKGIDPAQPVSLRVRYPQLEHFATLGRWFVPGYGRDDISIDMRPHYFNSDGHAPDPKTARFVGPRVPSPDSALYEPHSRQYWPGGSQVQEYDSTTFTNNHGYQDSDRFFDNPDHCVRLASTGGSDMVALQVRAFEKFNIILEESLGIALGKCVEVISAGADNGDLGTNYPRIRDYTSKFNVDHTLVSMASGLVYQVNPQMLHDGLGFDPENSALPNFYYDKSGSFTFRAASPVYPVFMSKPTHPEYVKGIPFGYTLSVPFDVMPDPGKEAFRYWTEIVKYIEQHHPGQKFIFHTGIDQAQCRKGCETTLTLADGRTVPAGAKIYAKDVTEYCQKNDYQCINPTFSDAYGQMPNLLTFEFDGHYSPLGHQWLAQQLTAPLVDILRAASR
ncbi:hypothetical protein HAP47_0011325 [Bradyrhizobium sp. 41S5]|uniref:hypothetical protein n=1 Tax=Bradyrhizobium sp. 41S5 TaxID=1404443 RepID=UPI001595845C|nr:hypothetical protein [Bradyrhizobium sp. 41S5]UFX47217.1 hypothetical protein HAP47_0011325 [Bradyrhizobium sp. 41S5]